MSNVHLVVKIGICSTVQDLMYWSEWDSHRIYSADKFHGRNVTAVTQRLAGVPMGLQLVNTVA